MKRFAKSIVLFLMIVVGVALFLGGPVMVLAAALIGTTNLLVYVTGVLAFIAGRGIVLLTDRMIVWLGGMSMP